MPEQSPIIPSLRDKTGRKHLTPAGIHKILAAFFEQMFNHLETDEHADKRLLSKLRQASAHWLRHSYGSYLVESRCGAVELGLTCLFPSLSFDGALVALP
jgi:hypothetical protein